MERRTVASRQCADRGVRFHQVKISQRSWRAALALFAVLGSVSVPAVFADHCSRGQATLTGVAINGVVPEGRAEWLGNSFCQPVAMRIEVAKVNLPDGTRLLFNACDSESIGSLSLQGGAGQLELRTDLGHFVPFCDVRFGEEVEAVQGGTIIVSGILCNPALSANPPC